LADLQKLSPVRFEADAHATITAGNASQLSDGASACVIMEEAEAMRRGEEDQNHEGYFIIFI
jgi:acetyl-CoA C-acetyltransferase